MLALASKKALRKALHGPAVGVLVPGVGYDADGLLTGLFADGVSAHAVGDDEQMASLAKVFLVRGALNREVILIMATADADVRQHRLVDLVELCHHNNPGTGRGLCQPASYT